MGPKMNQKITMKNGPNNSYAIELPPWSLSASAPQSQPKEACAGMSNSGRRMTPRSYAYRTRCRTSLG